MGQSKQHLRKLVPVTYKEVGVAATNFNNMKDKRHPSLNAFCGVTLDMYVTPTMVLPRVARRIDLMLSPHHVALYKAYCAKKLRRK